MNATKLLSSLIQIFLSIRGVKLNSLEKIKPSKFYLNSSLNAKMHLQIGAKNVLSSDFDIRIYYIQKKKCFPMKSVCTISFTKHTSQKSCYNDGLTNYLGMHRDRILSLKMDIIAKEIELKPKGLNWLIGGKQFLSLDNYITFHMHKNSIQL